jgi:hypothetical protein
MRADAVRLTPHALRLYKGLVSSSKKSVRREHTSAYVSIRADAGASASSSKKSVRREHTSAYVSIRRMRCVS